jgi:hypothetical protein
LDFDGGSAYSLCANWAAGICLFVGRRFRAGVPQQRAANGRSSAAAGRVAGAKFRPSAIDENRI